MEEPCYRGGDSVLLREGVSKVGTAKDDGDEEYTQTPSVLFYPFFLSLYPLKRERETRKPQKKRWGTDLLPKKISGETSVGLQVKAQNLKLLKPGPVGPPLVYRFTAIKPPRNLGPEAGAAKTNDKWKVSGVYRLGTWTDPKFDTSHSLYPTRMGQNSDRDWNRKLFPEVGGRVGVRG